MREIRIDPTTGEEVIISTARVKRPQYLHAGRQVDTSPELCPFCLGHELNTPPVLAEIADANGWRVRAFPNRYPALGIEGELERRAAGPYDRWNGVGAHEVIVESPHHDPMKALDIGQMTDALQMARDRMLDLERDPRFRSWMWFRNVGLEAGASIGHPHAQVMALPRIPERLQRLVAKQRHHWERTERELFDDILAFEESERVRWLGKFGSIAAFCPYASSAPYEVWLVPTNAEAYFSRTDSETLQALATAMVSILSAWSKQLGFPPYNALLYSAPRGNILGFRWHVRLIPRLTGIAGFERMAGGAIHGVPPEQAAEALRVQLLT